MQNQLSVLALLVGVAGAALGGYALTQQRADPTDASERMAALEEQVQRLTRTVESQAAREPGPLLTGLGRSASRRDATRAGALVDDTVARVGDDSEKRDAPTAATAVHPEAKKLQALVDAAVAKKAAQMQQMRNKKPSIDEFSKTLALTNEQRAAAERDILQSQHDIKSILGSPAEDGTNFLDELVDIMADGMAHPGKNKGRAAKLFGRLMTEMIPGTDETYAARVEVVKQRVRDAFRGRWSKAQYATFESWQMDPTEVKGVENSPWKELEVRIIERARNLGADIPATDG